MPAEEATREAGESTGALTPEPGGSVRLCLEGDPDAIDLLSPDSDLERYLAGAVGEGLVRRAGSGRLVPGVATSWSTAPEEGGEAWRFRLDLDVKFPDGSPVFVEDVIGSWERSLRDGTSPARWLLEPVVGVGRFVSGAAMRVEGVSASDDAVEVRANRPVPDLPERVTHPALAVWRQPGWGPGGFALRPGDLALEVNTHREPGARLSRVRLVQADEVDPASLVRLGETDVAVVYERAAARLRGDPPSSHGLERLPTWDRTYALWLNTRLRWTRDPTFRRWLAERLGAEIREAMVRLLFHGQGEPAHGLLANTGETASAESESAWKVPAGVEPRLTLAFEQADPRAASLAGKVKAEVEARGVGIDLAPLGREELLRRLSTGEDPLTLVSHRPWFHEPVLALRETLIAMGEHAADSLALLDEAERLPTGSDARRERARAAQRALTGDHRLLPLVRLHAWLVRPKNLEGVSLAPLSLRDARWRDE